MKLNVNELPITGTIEDSALEIIRSETALSRFPMHRIAKKGEISIEFKDVNSALYWNVSHNSRYGQPGPLAYKIETLLINRRIEKAGKPVPKIIKLGSLPEIAAELGKAAGNWNSLKQALLQNASAFITAKLSYRTPEGGDKWLEAGFTRYQVIFTGETLPDGRSADSVYVILSDVYHEVLNNAVFRPLDYEYMKELPPSAQRFYEIISYQVYAALKHKNPRAKLLYSEYCLLSTATRYFDFDHVKKQMYKVVRPHITSGYLAKIEYEALTNDEGQTDWMMYFSPGVNAGRQFRAFTGQGKTRRPKTHKAEPISPELTLPYPEMVAGASATGHDASGQGTNGQGPGGQAATHELIQALTEAELNRSDAERFAREKPAECRRQLAFLPHVREFKTSRGAYLRRAIEEGYGPPQGHAQEQAHQASREAMQRQGSTAARQAAEKVARQSHEERYSEPYLNYLRERVGELQKAQPEAFRRFEQGEADQRAALTSGPFAGRPLQQKALEVFDGEAMRLERARDFLHARGLPILSFWEWDAAQNPEPFRF